MKKISIIGLGKLGFPFAVCLAHKGFEVIGLDINKSLVNSMNEAVAPYYELDLQKLLDESKDRLEATTDHNYIINNSEITFIVVPTPSTAKGNFTNKYVIDCCKKIGPILKEKSSFHIWFFPPHHSSD